jgi:transposase InsO family protein
MNRWTSLGTATVRQICRAFDLSRQAYYAAMRPTTERIRIVKPRATRPCASVAEIEPEIRAIVAANPAWGVRKTWATLRRKGLRVSYKRVWALMRAWGLTLPPVAEREGPALRGQVVVPDSNRRWATDLTTVWTRRDATVAVVPVIDCGDRFVFQCDVTRSQEAPAVLDPVGRALTEAFGDPTNVPNGLELRSDHGPQYTGEDCAGLCATWRLDHTLAPVGRPTGNAVAERFIETLKVELIWTRDWESADELRAAIATWLDRYNHERPHQALEWMTPAEKRASNLGRQQRAAA